MTAINEKLLYKFSIIICTLNAEKYIERCIQSIITQSYNNYEVIIQDSNSSDETINIIKRFKNNNIKIFIEKDAGIYEGFNRAVKKSLGEWLIFMGSDDIFYDDNVLMSASDGAEKFKNASVIYGDTMMESNKYKNRFDWRMIFGNTVNHQAVFYKNIIFNKFQYDQNYRYSSDYKLNLQLLFAGNKIYRIKKIIADYSLTGVSSKNKNIGYLESCCIRREVLGYPSFIINKIIEIKRILL